MFANLDAREVLIITSSLGREDETLFGTFT